MADAAAMMSSTTVHAAVGRLRVAAKLQQSDRGRSDQEYSGGGHAASGPDADQTLAKALQKEIGSKEVTGLKTKVNELNGTGNDDGRRIGRRRRYFVESADGVHGLPRQYSRKVAGHSWESGVAMATPIAHKGSTAGAKAQAMTAIQIC